MLRATGRHLLQEQTVEVFVPNDTDVGAAHGRVNVVTGPNFSGKSVYLKQVALIVFLAHVGSFVPADAATVGITDRIFTRIASSDSIAAAVAQSSFMSDTHQARTLAWCVMCVVVCVSKRMLLRWRSCCATPRRGRCSSSTSAWRFGMLRRTVCAHNVAAQVRQGHAHGRRHRAAVCLPEQPRRVRLLLRVLRWSAIVHAHLRQRILTGARSRPRRLCQRTSARSWMRSSCRACRRSSSIP